MKVHIIVNKGYEYDDEYYHEPESEADVETIGYTDAKQAEDACDRLNGKHLRENPEVVTEDHQAIVPYKTVTVEIPDPT